MNDCAKFGCPTPYKMTAICQKCGRTICDIDFEDIIKRLKKRLENLGEVRD